MSAPTDLFDDTALSDFRLRGPRFFYFRHERGWVSPASAKAADWGTAWHDATATFVKVFGWPAETIAAYADELTWAAWGAFVETWDALYPAEPVAAHIRDPELELAAWDKSPLLAKPMLREYIIQRAERFSQLTSVGVEVPFVVPLFPTDSTIGYTGLIDRQVLVDNTEPAVIDVKTTGNYNYSTQAGIRPSWFKQFAVGSQLRGYIYATRLLTNDDTIRRAYIDASLRHRNKSVARPDVHVFHPLLFNDAQITEWLADAQQAVADVLENRRRQAAGIYAWPRACGGHCMTYGDCPYFDLCSSGQDPATLDMPTNLVERRWAPIKLPPAGK